jgi:hypothetical protein
MVCTAEEMEMMQRALYREVFEIIEAVEKEYPKDDYRGKWWAMYSRLLNASRATPDDNII